jgi:hypothetical protein
MTHVKACDQTTSGEKTAEFVIDLLTERVNVRELIRAPAFPRRNWRKSPCPP